MPDEQPRASQKFRAFLDGEQIPEGNLTIVSSPRDGMLCTLDGKVVKPVAVVHNEDSGEIYEIHLE